MTPDLGNLESLKACCQQRPDYPSLTIQTREALGCYYEGMALRRLINSYPKEDIDKFTWRRERMLEMNDNYVREVCSLYLEGVFRTKGPERKTGNAKLDLYLTEEYQRWYDDEFSRFALFLDEVFVVCTAPPARGKIYSLAQKNELQGLPYPAIYFPHYCVNLGYDDNRELEWACFFLGAPPELTDGGMPMLAERDQQDIFFELFTREYRVVINQKGEIQTGSLIEHGYGFLPVIRVQYGADHSANDPIRAGHALMRSIVKINLGGLSAKGALQDFQYYALYPKLVVGTETSENIIEDGSGAATPIRKAPESGGNKEPDPYYLGVPVQEFEALERIAYERIPTAAYRAARLRDRLTNKAVQSSGLSKMFDMVPELGVLKAVAKYLQRFDLLICKMLTALADGNPENVSVVYPSSFDTKSLSETLAELAQFGDTMKKSSMPSSEDGTLELAKRAWKGMIPDMPEGFYEKMFKQLEEAINAPDVVSDNTDIISGEPTDVIPERLSATVA